MPDDILLRLQARLAFNPKDVVVEPIVNLSLTAIATPTTTATTCCRVGLNSTAQAT